MIYIITFVLAFCSIIYELLLAQTLSTTMGNTILRYNITIGLYLVSLGFGAMIYEHIKDRGIKSLIHVEIALSIIGGLSPILVLFAEMCAREYASTIGLTYSSWLSQTILYIFNHLLIVVIGLLSGIELPCLMYIGKQYKKRSNRVLAVDYLGTLLGAMIFPLILLPVLGIIPLASLIGLLNISVALFLLFYQHHKWVKILFCILLFSLFCLGIYYQRALTTYIANQWYYF